MNEPDWSLLPQHPQAFFELDDGFDQKTLKRVYNRLLKKYKPEKAPDEFKRLRRAYEDLDEQLRYGRQLKQQDANTSYQWNADPPSDKANEGTKRSIKRSNERSNETVDFDSRTVKTTTC